MLSAKKICFRCKKENNKYANILNIQKINSSKNAVGTTIFAELSEVRLFSETVISIMK